MFRLEGGVVDAISPPRTPRQASVCYSTSENAISRLPGEAFSWAVSSGHGTIRPRSDCILARSKSDPAAIVALNACVIDCRPTQVSGVGGMKQNETKTTPEPASIRYRVLANCCCAIFRAMFSRRTCSLVDSPPHPA